MGSSLQAVSESWRLDTELLLADALHESREHLHAWPEREVSAAQMASFQVSLQRREQGEPVAYILGRKAFWDFELSVNSSVLIPRPETELLVEKALDILTTAKAQQQDHSVRIADLGTGSGAIAIALARADESWSLTAVDVSEAALSVARGNALTLGANNIEFLQASWCESLDAEAYQLIVANPPYVAAGDAHLQRGDLVFEPSIALEASEEGLSDIRQIVIQSRACLMRDGWLLFEHGYDQAVEVEKILRDAGFSNIGCQQDYAGLDRLSFAQSTKSYSL